MLSGLRKLGAARLHLLAEHGRLHALLEAYGPAAGLALERPVFRQSCKPFSYTPAGEEVELTLPDDLSVIGGLNPQLRDVILAHQKFERESAKGGLRSRLQGLLAAADPGRRGSSSLTKTSLLRLRVDQLRAALEEENADTRGTKDVLVQRLLGMLVEGERQEGQLLPSMEDFEEGIVTRRQVSQQARRAARRGQDAATYGVPESSLRAAQAAATAAAEKSRYARVFAPEEVATLLLEARASDVCVIDVRRRCPFADYMVLGTARSQALVRQLAGGVLHQLKARCKEVAPGVMPSIEGGKEDSEWMVVDAGSVVVHIFLEGWREEYDLEGLWGEPDGSNLRWLQPKQTVQTLQTIR